MTDNTILIPAAELAAKNKANFPNESPDYRQDRNALPFPFRYSREQIKFARDLQDRLGILALLALSAPFRFCRLQILLAKRETDPVSGHHILSDLRDFPENA